VLLTSLALLLTAVGLVITGAIEGSVTILAISLGCAVGGAAALVAANALAPKMAEAAGAASAADLAMGGFIRAGAQAPAPGDGLSSVPLSAWAGADTPPIPGYDEMAASQVARLVDSGALGRPALAALLAYEASHAARKTVVAKLERALGVRERAR
jgi:hypothetical protein